MKKKLFFLLMILGLFLGTTACRNLYDIPTYRTTDSYGSVFEGNYVPKDVR